jgi:hypothetical protein
MSSMTKLEDITMLRVPLEDLLTTFSIVFDYVDWWNSVFA